MTRFQKLLLLFILITAFVFRFGSLGNISTGIHADEVSQAYNAHSLLKTGKDMYGKVFPVLFRANGSYQPPVYTYLTILPVAIFGNTILAAKFISALSGVILVGVTYLLVYFFGIGKRQERVKQALLVSLTLAISPWSVHFSRLAVEGNLVVVFFVTGLLVAMASLKRKGWFLLASFVMAITTHVYYTERITAFLFLILFTYMFRDFYVKRRKEIVFGFIIFFIVLIPHIFIARTGALTKRLTQVSYTNDIKFREGSLINKVGFVTGQFADHYFSYFSPKNLFFDPGQSLGRTTSDLSVFYPWFFIFVISGLSFLLKNRKEPLIKTLFMVSVVSPIPAGLTGDLFYPLRVLTFLWSITIIVAYGFYSVWRWMKPRVLRIILFISIFSYSAFYFYVSYFATARYATSPDLGYSYIKLIELLPKYTDKKIVVDFSSRSWGVGIRMMYLLKAGPEVVQENLSSQLRTPYYSDLVNAWEVYSLDNLIIKPLRWEDVCGEDIIIVGDRYSISEPQIVDHKLKLEFAIKNIVNEDVLFGYSTTQKCL